MFFESGHFIASIFVYEPAKCVNNFHIGLFKKWSTFCIVKHWLIALNYCHIHLFQFHMKWIVRTHSGAPEKAKWSQVGGMLICEAKLTSLPADYRHPQSSMQVRWYSRDEQSSDDTLNYTLPDRKTRLPRDQSFLTMTQPDHGKIYSCATRENGSDLWSEPSDWYKPLFPAAGKFHKKVRWTLN